LHREQLGGEKVKNGKKRENFFRQKPLRYLSLALKWNQDAGHANFAHPAGPCKGYMRMADPCSSYFPIPVPQTKWKAEMWSKKTTRWNGL
jgi:hypothetical protein